MFERIKLKLKSRTFGQNSLFLLGTSLLFFFVFGWILMGTGIISLDVPPGYSPSTMAKVLSGFHIAVTILLFISGFAYSLLGLFKDFNKEKSIEGVIIGSIILFLYFL